MIGVARDALSPNVVGLSGAAADPVGSHLVTDILRLTGPSAVTLHDFVERHRRHFMPEAGVAK